MKNIAYFNKTKKYHFSLSEKCKKYSSINASID